MLIKEKIAYEINSAEDITEMSDKLLNEKRKKIIAQKCNNYIKQNIGATDMILSYLKKNF